MIAEATLNDTRVHYQRFTLYAKQSLFEEFGISWVSDICLPCDVRLFIRHFIENNSESVFFLNRPVKFMLT
jgi:hypothetical protein